MNIDEQEFERFCTFLRDVSGISLTSKKRYLVTSRIKRILVENGVSSISDLMAKLSGKMHSTLKDRVIDAMTTNETYWFRDSHPFDYLKSQLLPELVSKSGNGPEIRIWCAACSSGQEPYSIAMMVDEFKRQSYVAAKKAIKILATEISRPMLDMAQAGIYDRMSLDRGLSREHLQRYFQPVSVAAPQLEAQSNISFGNTSSEKRGKGLINLAKGECWQIQPTIRDYVEYRQVNLVDSYAGLGYFDIIFCRNVLIYFSKELKQDVLRRLHASLKPGGYLFLGSSEGLGDSAHLFEMVHCSPGIVYRARQK